MESAAVHKFDCAGVACRRTELPVHGAATTRERTGRGGLSCHAASGASTAFAAREAPCPKARPTKSHSVSFLGPPSWGEQTTKR